MIETAFLLAFCLLMGLLSLVVVVWLIVTGRIFGLDGLSFALISLTLGVFFMFNVAWSMHTGELQEVLKHFRKGSTQSDDRKIDEGVGTGE